jgi:hypothetical protein
MSAQDLNAAWSSLQYFTYKVNVCSLLIYGRLFVTYQMSEKVKKK